MNNNIDYFNVDINVKYNIISVYELIIDSYKDL